MVAECNKACLAAQISRGQYVVDLARDKKLLELLGQIDGSVRDVQVAYTKYQDHQLLKPARQALAGLSTTQNIQSDQESGFTAPADCSV